MPWKKSQEKPWEMPQEIANKMPREMPLEILGNWVEGKNLFNKAVIGGNLAFVMGDGELTNQHPAGEMPQEIPGTGQRGETYFLSHLLRHFPNHFLSHFRSHFPRLRLRLSPSHSSNHSQTIFQNM